MDGPLAVEGVAENRFGPFKAGKDGRGLTLETMTLLDVAVEEEDAIIEG